MLSSVHFLEPTQPGRFPLVTLQIGPMAAMAQLADLRDNDGLGQGQPEALYVDTLQIDAGTTLSNAACRLYYNQLINNGTVTNPENLIQLGYFSDLTVDGKVDLADLAELLGHYGTTGGATYADVDLDGVGEVDLSDLAELQGHYGE